MEHKQTENAIVTCIDEDKGIVEAVWAVMGNVDGGGDIIHPGAFKKTFHESRHQIKLLDNHRSASVMDSLGVVIEVKELTGAHMPQALMNAFPDATAAAFGKFQFLLDTPEGKGAFSRLKAGAIQGWSFGYDVVDKDHTTITKDGESVRVRNLRAIKLYEISPVLFPMNEATITTDVKKDESKQDTIAEKQDTIAEKQDTIAEKQDTIAEKQDEPGDEEKAGRVLSAQNIKRITNALNSLKEALNAAGVVLETDGPSKAETPTPDANGAGPLDTSDTSLLELISIELEDLEV